MTSLSEKTINNALTRSNSAEILSWGIPDYSAGVTKSQTTGSTISSTVDGVLCVWLKGNINTVLKRNDDNGEIACGIYGGSSMGSTCYFPIGANENYYVSEGYTLITGLKITFYPYKGVK